MIMLRSADDRADAERPSYRTRLSRALLPPTTAGRMLMVAFLVDTLGTGLFIAGSVVFFIKHVGLSTAQVAIGLSVAGLTGFVASVPVGVLADRLGVRRVQVALHLWRATGFVLYVFCTNFVSFLLVTAMIGVGDRTSPTLNQALVAMSVSPEARVRTMSLLRAAKNLSFTAGGLLAAALLAVGSPVAYQALVLANAASFVAVALIVSRLPLLTGTRPPRAAAWWRLPSLRDRRWLGLAGVNGVLCLHNSLLLVGIPLFILTRTSAPRSLVALLFVVNTVLVVLGQVRIGRATERAGAIRGFRITGLVLALTCLVLVPAELIGTAAAIAVLLAAATVLTIGEMVQSAVAWDVSFVLAPAARQAEYLTVFNLGTTLETVAGPLIIPAIILRAGFAGWPALAAVFLGAGLLGARLATTPTIGETT